MAKKQKFDDFENYLDAKFDRFLSLVERKRAPLIVTFSLHLILVIVATNLYFDFDAQAREQLETVTMADIAILDKMLDIQEKEQKMSQTDYRKMAEQATTNRASNLSATQDMQQLRERLTSLDQVQDVTRQYDENGNEINVDLFSDDAKKKVVKEENQVVNHSKQASEDGKIEKKVYSGASTITFDLAGRYELELPNPIYTCPQGGLVVLDVQVGRNGKVLSVRVNHSLSRTSAQCLQDAAVTYARRARFNVSSDAPEPQAGTLSYMFQR